MTAEQFPRGLSDAHATLLSLEYYRAQDRSVWLALEQIEGPSGDTESFGENLSRYHDLTEEQLRRDTFTLEKERELNLTTGRLHQAFGEAGFKRVYESWRIAEPIRSGRQITYEEAETVWEARRPAVTRELDTPGGNQSRIEGRFYFVARRLLEEGNTLPVSIAHADVGDGIAQRVAMPYAQWSEYFVMHLQHRAGLPIPPVKR